MKVWEKKGAKKIFKKDVEKMKYPKPKISYSRDPLLPFVKKKPKKGQMLMIGILFIVMALLIFVATLPATKNLIDKARGCNSLNCAGYIDKDATAMSGGCPSTNQSYDSSYEEDDLSCTIIDLMLPFLILGVLGGLVYKITRGEVTEAPAAYGGY